MEDHDSERLTDVVDAIGGGPVADGLDDDPVGMRVGPGTEINGYVIDGELGHGGMGVVYSATHPVIGKRAAIKILRLGVSRSPIAVERFIQEARAVNQIGHPNIVDIFAYGALPDGRAYHVMDLLEGESLRRRLRRGVLHPSEAASVIDEISQALTAAHDRGFVHRDLKPDNVFLVDRENRWPEVKLLDFGLAKLMPERGVPAFTTKAGVMLGTPEYMSPEQARGIGVDYRTDIYALGILMFEILAGNRPFPPMAEPLATLLQHAEEPPASLADVVSGLPDEMVQLVAAMLAKTPQARPSLAAVRTVIKRLRTTQLPTRSLAGVQMASLSQPDAPGLAITASRVGAAAVLPGDSQQIARPQLTTAGIGVESLRAGTNPSLPAYKPGTGLPPTGVAATAISGTLRGSGGVAPVPVPPVMPSRPSAASYPGSAPPGPSHASHGGPRSHSPSSPPHTAHAAPMSAIASHPGVGAPPAPVLHDGPTNRTALGIGPAKVPIRPAPPPPAAVAAPRGRRGWLIFAILVVLAAAIALAIVLLGPSL